MRAFALLLLLTVMPARAGEFTPTPVPALGNTRATADLPAAQHKKNVGGSDGAGLCVYTSAWHAAIWQDARDLFGFRAWMQKRPGGSYPDKFDATLAAFCKEKGIPLPAYVQHTGGDAEFLALALKTGRMVCCTYCGVDGPAGYGSEVVAHMVNLVHLDAEQAAILDNNFPGRWLWMGRADFLARWRGVKPDGSAFLARDRFGRGVPIGGGWAIVLLNPPPAPYPDDPARTVAAAGWPLLVGQNCPNGRCPVPVGDPPTPDHVWGRFADGAWGWRFKDQVERTDLAPAAPAIPHGGVDSARLSGERSYSLSGVPCSKTEALDALTLTDDSGRWHLSVVGDAALCSRVKADTQAIPAAVRARLHVQCYAPSSWQAAQFGLPAGVTLRRPAVNRVGGQVGTVAAESYSPTALAAMLAEKGGPSYVEPQTGPENPNRPPAPPKGEPVPTPPPDAKGYAGLVALVLAVFALVVSGTKKK